MCARTRRWAAALAVATAFLAAGPATAQAVTIITVNQTVDSPSAVRQTGRVAPTGSPSACGALGLAPTLTGTGQEFNLRSHTLRNALLDPVCITVELTSGCTGGDAVSSVSYTPPLVPADPLANYLGALGSAATTTPKTYSFTVPAGALWGTVVHGTTAGAGCAGYTIKLSSDGPWADAAPTVAGTGELGTTLTGTDTTWKAAPAVERRWLRCDRQGAGCSEIPGATAATYTVSDADLGSTLRFLNRATDADATNRSQSPPVEPHIPFAVQAGESLAPGDRVHAGMFVRTGVESRCGTPAAAPTILSPTDTFLFDTFAVQSVLNESVCLTARTTPACGTGASPSIYSPAFSPATSIAENYRGNAGGATFAPGAVGWLLPAAGAAEVVVSAGTGGLTCPSYGLTLAADAPFALARPAVAGSPAEGATLTSTPGTWSGAPSLGRAWLRCDAAGDACGAIPGATGETHVATAADAGRRLRVRVTATRGRSVSSDSAPTAVIAAAPPPAPAPAGPPAASAPLRDVRAPALRIALARTTLQQVRRRGSLPVTVTCDEPCTLTLAAQVSRGLGRRLGGTRVASGRGRAAAGRRTTIRIRLTRRARRGLARRTTLTLSLRATASDGAGNRRTVTRRATVRRARGGR